MIEGRPLSWRTSAALLLLLGALLAYRARDPWRYLHDDNGRRYSSYARTHLTLGFAGTGGHDFFLDRRTGRLVPYGHHPSGLGLLLAGWFALIGSDGPGAARGLAAGFHLVSAALVLAVLRRQYPGAGGAVAALALAVVPMSSFFGKLVNFEPFVLPFLIGAVLAYWRWTDERTPGFLVLAFALVAAGTLIDWPILLTLPVFAVDGVLRWRREGDRSFAVASVVACILGVVLGGGMALWVTAPVGLDELGRAARFRLRLHGGYTWWRIAGRVIDYNRRYFTEPLLVAAVVAAGLLVREAWRGRPLPPCARLLALFGVVGIAPVIIFPSSALHHAYWQFYLLPYAVLSLAYVLDHLPARGRRLAHAVVVVWVLAASAYMLSVRYSRPSGYVARKVRSFEPYL